MKKRQFFKNALILTATALILRAVGMLFRIYLADKIGAEGMGLYQLIISVYVLASTFATTGVNTAVTRLVTDELVRGTKKTVAAILRRALILITIVGVASCLLIYYFAPTISALFIKDTRATLALQILSFSLPFMGISACIKGYFMARRKVSGNSNAQLFEQTVRIALVVFLLSKFADKGVTFCCAAVLLGDTVAEACSCFYMTVCYFLDKRKLTVTPHTLSPQKKVYRTLLKIAVPISAGRYLSTGLRTVESMLVPETLGRYSGSKSQGLSQFGMLKGMALPVLFFPSSFLMAMSMLLIPEISEAAALDDKTTIHTTTARSIRITLFCAMLIAGVFTLFSQDVGLCVYKDAQVGFFIKVLSPLIPFMYLESVVDGMLKGLNQQNRTLLYAVSDSALRIALIWFLVPRYGMVGFLSMMVLSNVFTASLNVHRILSVSGVKFKWIDWVIKPLATVLVSGGVTYLIVCVWLGATAGWLRLIVGVLLISVLYILLSFVFGFITQDDLSMFKRRKKLSKGS